MADIEIEIDGKKLTAKPNQTVIQVADDAGIYIPRFCYHKHLSIPANCRMCLVEMEKAPKPIPACATPATPGMKIHTKSAVTLSAQRAVMEFLLINHPLDCPICDQGGECELQDLAMGYGSPCSEYKENKRAVPDQNLGPLIATEMTRCIYCTRCVRFGDEVAGFRELGAISRGEFTEISTYVQHAIQSEVSGNIIDLCPVGALTSKPYRFKARPWELDQAPSIAPHDCIGSNLNIHTRYGKVLRVVAREHMSINETWISDRDRFSYTGLYHPDRLEEPVARIEGELRVVEWQEALEMAAAGLQDTISKYGSDKFGALASPNSTLEEFYLLQKLVRGLGSPHVDHRLREIDTRDQAELGSFPGLNMPISAVEHCDAILLIGSNLHQEQPMLGLRVRKAVLNGASVIAINAIDYRFNFEVNAKKIVSPRLIPTILAALAKALGRSDSWNEGVKVDDDIQKMAELFKHKQKICILLGASVMHHPDAAEIRYLTQEIAKVTNAHLGLMTDGANGAGGWLAGAVPHRHADGSPSLNIGLNAYEMFEKARKSYLLVNIEPDLDCANSYHAVEALKQAKCVIALSMYRNPILEKYAHVILPMAPFTETSGTFINVMGTWQSFNGVAKNYYASRPAWKILRALGNFLRLTGFDFETPEEVRHEVKSHMEKSSPTTVMLSQPNKFSSAKEKKLMRIGEIPIYSIDSLVRRAHPLQETQTIMQGDVAVLRIHPETAQEVGVRDGEMAQIKQGAMKIQLPVMYDTRVALDSAWIPGGIPQTADLGDLIGEIHIISERNVEKKHD